MKKILYIFVLTLSGTFAQAQVKVGDNPGTINGGSALEIESTNKGLLMPRVALTTTTTWGLAGTAVAGMSVYNTSTGLTSSNVAYPAMGVGEYYWDGTGWVSKKGGSTGTTSVNADNGLTVGYNSTGNVGLGGTLSKNTDVATDGKSMSFSGTGSFGLGTASPQRRLHLVNNNGGDYSDDILVQTYSVNSTPGIFFHSAGGTVASPTNIVTSRLLGTVGSSGQVGGNETAMSAIKFFYEGDGTTNLSSMRFFTNNTSRMMLNENGNLGIGTASPTQILDVNGRARIRTIDASTSTTDVALVADADGVIKKKIDQVKGIFRSYLASDFSSGSATGNIYKITNHNEIDDPNSDFNTSASTFTAPITGLYRVTMTVTNTKLAGATLGANIVVGVADASTNNWIIRFSIDSGYVAETNETGTANTFVGFLRLTQGQSCYYGATGGIRILANPTGGSGTGIGTLFEIQLIKN